MEKKSVYIKIGIGVVVLLVGIVVFALGCAEIDRFSSSEIVLLRRHRVVLSRQHL